MSRAVTFAVPPSKPVLRGVDHYWRTILELDRAGPWGITDIRGLSNGARFSTIRNFVQSLVAGGIADTATLDGEVRYRLRQRPNATPSLNPDGTPRLGGRCQVQMWNLIRGPMGRDGVNHKDLALFASTEAVKIEPETAARYLRRLAQAGYLLTLRAGSTGSPAVYRLKPAMNTGPLPPIVLRSLIVFDQNREAAVGPVEGCEVAA